MNERLIQNLHIPLSYELKPGTKGSFYQVAGIKGFLPKRLSFGIYGKIKPSSRGLIRVNGFKAEYCINESGIYKGLNDRRIQTSIWKSPPEYPEFYGYGILDERFKIFDLLIFYSENMCASTFEIHVFKGMGKPDYENEAFSYLRNYKKKKPHF